MEKRSGLIEAIATWVVGFFLCIFVTGIIPGGSNEERAIMLVFIGIIFLSGIIVQCTCRIINAINEVHTRETDKRNIEYISGKSDIDKKMGDKYGK